MPETENVDVMNLSSSLEWTSSLIEKLGKAFVELEAQADDSIDIVKWKHVEGHFRFLESVTKKKLEELEAKEKGVTEKESLLAEREAAVTAEEQDLLDRVQEQKDDAVASITEANDVYKVSCSANDENAEVVAAGLTEFCEQMDSKGLLNFVMENLNGLSSVCRKQLSVVLVRATEPARLVLNTLEGFFPPVESTQHGNDSGDALHGMRQSCVLIMEALSAFLARANSTADNFLNPETKQHAKAIADEWKPKLSLESTDAANGKSLEAREFLRLLVTFRITSEFDAEELCKCVLATAHHRQATEICRCLDLSQKIPGIVEKLIKDGRNIEAVNFILSFQLSEAFPPVPLLKAYLKEVRRNLQGNGDAETQNNFNAQELTAIKAVMRCVKEYKLEADYPLDQLRKRFVQLQNSVWDRKRKREKVKRTRNESQVHEGSHEPKARGSESSTLDPLPLGLRASYTGLTERYPPAVPSAYSYPVSSPSLYAAQANDRSVHSYQLPSQSTYAAETNDRRPYYYPQGDSTSAPYPTRAPGYSASAPYPTGAPGYSASAPYPTGAPGYSASAPYATGAPGYSAYTQPPQQPYM